MKNLSLLSATILLIGVAQRGQATPLLDQQFICSPCVQASVQPLALGLSYGLTFTAGISGRLVGADLALDAVMSGRTLNDVLVEVTTTNGGFPTSNVLASGIISGASIPVTGFSVQFTHVDFPAAIGITAGQQLALLFFGLGILANDPNILFGGPTQSYAGGQGVVFAFNNWVPAGQVFNPGATGPADFAFRTSVDAVPEPASLVLLGAGLGVLIGCRRRFLCVGVSPVAPPHVDRLPPIVASS